MKVFYNYCCTIDGIPQRHRSHNGSNQKQVVVRCRSLTRMAQILGTTIYQLRTYGGVQEVSGGTTVTCLKGFDFQGMEDEAVYYRPENCNDGWINEWVKLEEGK